MRLKIRDIRQAIKDETPVAVAFSTYDEFEHEYRPPLRAEVLETNVPRRVHSGRRDDISGHNANDGIRVRFLDNGKFAGSEVAAGDTKVVGPARIWATWQDWSLADAEWRANREQASGQIEQQKSICETARANLGIGTVRPVLGKDYKTVGWQLVISSAECEDLLLH